MRADKFGRYAANADLHWRMSAQTFQKHGNGTHTIAAEFRTGGADNHAGEIKCVVQTYEAAVEETSQPQPEPEPQPEPQPEPEQEYTTYTVVAGDSLWRIAQKFYGKGTKWNTIYQANQGIIKNANLIYVGQVLLIPVL